MIIETNKSNNKIRDYADFNYAMSAAVEYVTDTSELIRLGSKNPNIQRINQHGRELMQDLATKYPDMWQKYQTAYGEDNPIIANFKLLTL